MSIVLVGSTSGSVTLQEPAVAGTSVLSLPALTGTVLTTASTFGGTGPAFSAYASATQTITLATNTKVTLDVENFDTNNNFASSTFTPTVAGYYQVTGMVRGSAATTFTTCNGIIFKNGVGAASSANSGTFTAGSFITATVSDVIYMNGTTDYLELYGTVSGSGTASFNFTTVAATSRFSACLVRTA